MHGDDLSDGPPSGDGGYGRRGCMVMIWPTIHHLAMVATGYDLGISQGSHRRPGGGCMVMIWPTVHHLAMVATEDVDSIP
jgi:hypothetical protein